MADDATPQRLTVFISYARRDAQIADRLVSDLETAGFAVIIDRRDLPYGEAWQGELADFIRTSDTVIWLVSGASLASRWCRWELGEVLRTRKRLLPVAIETISPDDLPEELGRLHILPATGAFDFAQHLPLLTDTLNTDRGWLKEHTRLADRARQWTMRDRAPALLLRGVALTDAERWASRKPPAAPAPPDDVMSLLLASRQGQVRRQRSAIAVSAAAAVVGVGLAGIATWQWRTAEDQRVVAVRSEERAIEQQTIAEQRAVAEREARQQAERNFAAARDSLDHLIGEVVSDLSTASGVGPESLHALLQGIEQSVGALNAAAPGDDGLIRLRAAMLVRFGEAYLTALDPEAAAGAFGAAADIYRDLLVTSPQDATLVASLALTERSHAEALRRSGDLETALAVAEAGVATAGTLSGLPDDPDHRLVLAGTQAGLALVLADLGEDAAAFNFIIYAVAIKGQTLDTRPDDRVLQYRLAAALDLEGMLYLREGTLDLAAPNLRRALELRNALAESTPDNGSYQVALAESHFRMADLHLAGGRDLDAIQSLHDGRYLLHRLFERDFEGPSVSRMLADAHMRLGTLQLTLDTNTALENFAFVISSAHAWLAAKADDVAALTYLARAAAGSASAYEKLLESPASELDALDQLEYALAAHDSSIDAWQRAVAAAPDATVYRDELVRQQALREALIAQNAELVAKL